MSSKLQIHSIPREKLGPAGMPGVFIIQLTDSRDEEGNERRRNDQEERRFEVTCVLAKDYGFNSSIPTETDKESGASFFLVPPEVAGAKITNNFGEYEFHRNENHEISTITHQCQATSWHEAHAKFLNGLTPFLDYISYVSNTPLIISRIVGVDHKNATTSVNYFTPYSDVTINPHQLEFNSFMFPVYALYREGKNSSSLFYRFLCCYKILEGIYDILRPKLFDLARKQNISINTEKEIVPDHEELQRFTPEYIGRPIKEFMDNELQKEYRDTVAHFMLKSGSLLNPSDYYTDAKFSRILLPAELAARKVIEVQGNYVEQFVSANGKFP